MNENKIELSGIFENGYGIISKKLMQSKNLNVYDKCIIAYMLSFTGGGNVCFPSYKKISKDLQISEPTIAKSLKKLNLLKYIKTEKLYPEDKLKHNNKYILSFLTEAPLLNDVKCEDKPSEVSTPLEIKPQPPLKLSSNNNIFNKNKINKIAGKTEPAHRLIKSIFADGSKLLNADPYYHDGKQAKAVSNLEPRYKEDPEKFETLTRKFFEIIKTAKEPYWNSCSFDPATFQSRYNAILAYKLDKGKGYNDPEMWKKLEAIK
jgi:DNA-binding Lrp family transcriptional regulator